MTLQFKFATFNKRLLRTQHQRLASIRNLNHRNEIEYHKMFNNSKELENSINSMKNSLTVIRFQVVCLIGMLYFHDQKLKSR